MNPTQDFFNVGFCARLEIGASFPSLAEDVICEHEAADEEAFDADVAGGSNNKPKHTA